METFDTNETNTNDDHTPEEQAHTQEDNAIKSASMLVPTSLLVHRDDDTNDITKIEAVYHVPFQIEVTPRVADEASTYPTGMVIGWSSKVHLPFGGTYHCGSQHPSPGLALRAAITVSTSALAGRED